MGSSGGGVLLVLTAQNLHPRVQVSPSSMMVAVATPSPPPFQQSPMLGHWASSQTVWRFNRERESLTSSNLSPCGALCFSHAGFWTVGSRPVYGPTVIVFVAGFFACNGFESTASQRILGRELEGFGMGYWSLGNGEEREEVKEEEEGEDVGRRWWNC